MRDELTCSHTWIDPNDAPIARAPYAPIVGPLRRQMKPGRRYRCRECGRELKVPARGGEGAHG